MNTSKTDQYVVYLTLYSGTKMPKWYIGSSRKNKVINGYNGSITSKKYRDIYKYEQLNNKHLFRTRILSYHRTREQALIEELRLQKLHLVVTNMNYFNQSYAQPNGMFGMDVSGDLNPNNGNKWNGEQKEHLSNLMKGCFYYNNGIKTIRVNSNAAIPIGFIKGVLKKPSSEGKIWVNNGKNEYYIEKEFIEENCIIGRLTKSIENKLSITNGIDIKFIQIDEIIPNGWYAGTKKIKCSKCGNYFDAGNLKLRHNDNCVCFSLHKGNIKSTGYYTKEDLMRMYGGLVKSSIEKPIGYLKIQITILTKKNMLEYLNCFVKEIV